MPLRLSRNYELLTLGLAWIACLTGCTANIHYRSYLMVEQPIPVQDEFHHDDFLMQFDNAILIHPGQRIQLRLDDIRVGFTHRHVVPYIGWDRHRGPVAFEDSIKNGLGGNDFWLVVEAVSLDNRDIFGVKQKRIMSAINVKLDRESYTFLPLDRSEHIVLDEVADRSYRIRLVLYQVYGYPEKKLLHGAFRGVLPAIWEAGKVALMGLGNAIFAPIIDLIENKADEPMFFEKILLEASAERELVGSFDLISTDAGEENSQQTYALYDFVKSELDLDHDGIADRAKPLSYTSDKGSVTCDNQKLIDLISTHDEYRTAYLCVHGQGVVSLPSKASATASIRAGVYKDLEKSYVRFTILGGDKIGGH